MQSLTHRLTGAIEDRRILIAMSSVIVAAGGVVAPLLQTTAAWRLPGGNDFVPYLTLGDMPGAARLYLATPAAVLAGVAGLLTGKRLGEAPWARRRPVLAPVAVEGRAPQAASKTWADRMNW
jgi:hypothetical protein